MQQKKNRAFKFSRVVKSWHLKLGHEIQIVYGEPRFLLAPKVTDFRCQQLDTRSALLWYSGLYFQVRSQSTHIPHCAKANYIHPHFYRHVGLVYQPLLCPMVLVNNFRLKNIENFILASCTKVNCGPITNIFFHYSFIFSQFLMVWVFRC